jgi:hypothetical protein
MAVWMYSRTAPFRAFASALSSKHNKPLDGERVFCVQSMLLSTSAPSSVRPCCFFCHVFLLPARSHPPRPHAPYAALTQHNGDELYVNQRFAHIEAQLAMLQKVKAFQRRDGTHESGSHTAQPATMGGGGQPRLRTRPPAPKITCGFNDENNNKVHCRQPGVRCACPCLSWTGGWTMCCDFIFLFWRCCCARCRKLGHSTHNPPSQLFAHAHTHASAHCTVLANQHR